MSTSVKDASSALVGPNAWLKELTRLKPARWHWGRSIRAALAMGIPLSVGVWMGDMASVLFVAMGAMLQGMGERDAPYPALFKKALISAPLGALAFLLGYLNGVPWGVIVLVMAGVAFVAAILSSYAAPLSVGCLQLLAMGAVLIGNPELAPYWPTALKLLLGSALYMVLLGLEALFFSYRPERQMVSALLSALAALAQARAQRGADSGQARQNVTDQLAALYGLLLQRRSHALGVTAHLNRAAALLQRADALFAQVMSCADSAELLQAGADLRALAQAYDAQARDPAALATAPGQPLSAAIAALGQALWGRSVEEAMPRDEAAGPRESRLALLRDKLTRGRQVMQPALALALCTGIAYSFYWIDDKSHWYWVPMTVCIVMKPDMGSIFARAVLRCVGTGAGVLVGALIMAWLPTGYLFVLAMVAIAVVMPWLSQRSYALLAFSLTPLVLVLIDSVSPETRGTNYAVLRLVDTLLGAAIVLVFGYLIWPRGPDRQMEPAFLVARQQIARYLRVSVAGKGDVQQIRLCRRQAYGALSDMRLQLQQALGDPPPAGREAAAWFPMITGAERICDAITAYSSQLYPAPAPEDARRLEQLAELLEAGLDAPQWQHIGADLAATSPQARLVNAIQGELRQARKMLGATSAPQAA